MIQINMCFSIGLLKSICWSVCHLYLDSIGRTELCGKKREKIEPELPCRPSIEHLKSPGPYDVFYRMGYAVLKPLGIHATRSQLLQLSSVVLPGGWLVFDWFSCVSEPVWISAAPWPCLTTRTRANPHRDRCCQILHWSLPAAQVSVCLWDGQR